MGTLKRPVMDCAVGCSSLVGEESSIITSAAASGRFIDDVSYRFLTPTCGAGGGGSFSPLAFFASASSAINSQSFPLSFWRE